MAFGTDFSKIWTAESLGIEMPPNTDCTVFSYLINSSLKAVDWHFSSISPTVNRVSTRSDVIIGCTGFNDSIFSMLLDSVSWKS